MVSDNRSGKNGTPTPPGREPRVSDGEEPTVRPQVSAENARSRSRDLESLGDDVRSSGVHVDGGADDDDDLLELMQQMWLNSRLPDPPAKPGFHRLWVSTTNSQTPPSFFERLGYRPVPPEEWQGSADLSLTTASSPGLVTVKEMLLYEIPVKRYQKYMAYLHHHAPLEEERRIKEVVQQMRTVDGSDLRREVGDGTAMLGRPRPVPEFG